MSSVFEEHSVFRVKYLPCHALCLPYSDASNPANIATSDYFGLAYDLP